MDKDFLEYFINRTDQKFDHLENRLNDLDKKLNTLLRFKWHIMGGAGAIGVIAAAAWQIVGRYIS